MSIRERVHARITSPSAVSRPLLEGKLMSRPFLNRLSVEVRPHALYCIRFLSLPLCLFYFYFPCISLSFAVAVELIYEILADFKKEKEEKGGLVPSRVFFPTSFEFIGPTEIFNASNIIVLVVHVIHARNPLLVLSHFVARRRTLTESRIRSNPRFNV